MTDKTKAQEMVDRNQKRRALAVKKTTPSPRLIDKERAENQAPVLARKSPEKKASEEAAKVQEEQDRIADIEKRKAAAKAANTGDAAAKAVSAKPKRKVSVSVPAPKKKPSSRANKAAANKANAKAKDNKTAAKKRGRKKK